MEALPPTCMAYPRLKTPNTAAKQANQIRPLLFIRLVCSQLIRALTATAFPFGAARTTRTTPMFGGPLIGRSAPNAADADVSRHGCVGS